MNKAELNKAEMITEPPDQRLVTFHTQHIWSEVIKEKDCKHSIMEFPLLQ